MRTHFHRPASLLRFAAAALACAWAFSAPAEEVGFVNVPEVMSKAPQAIAARERLEQEFAARRKKLRDCGEEIDDLDRILRREGREMEKGRRDRMIDRVKRKRRECGDLKDEVEADFNKRRSEELNELQKQITEVINNIAEKRKIQLIVGPPVIYAADQINLTEEVLGVLSKEDKR